MGDGSFAAILCVAALAGVVVGQITALMFFTAVSGTTTRRNLHLLRQYQVIVPRDKGEALPGPVKFGPGTRTPTGKLIRDWHHMTSPDQPTQPHPVIGKNGMHP